MTKVFKKPTISVVVPIYNVEKYLKKCVDSIINQSYHNLEIILVDDGSPDNSPKICDEYALLDTRIKVIHKKNGGLSDARNAGIDIATGAYITFIDSDDYIEPNYMEVLLESITNNNSEIAIGGHTVYYETGGVIERNTCGNKKMDSKEALRRILYDDGIDLSAWAKLYDINLFKNIRYPKGRLFEDSATTYKLIDKAKIISTIDTRIYNYIMRTSSITNSTFNSKKMDLILSTTEMCDYIKKKYPDLSLACERRKMYAYLSTISQLASSKDKYKEEQKILMDYIKKNSKTVLKDKKIPKRDRLALHSLSFGFGVYKVIWNLYRKWSKRI